MDAQTEQQPLPQVLIVEDEETIVELIRLGLRYEGFQVESCDNGLDAVSAAQRLLPNLVILDLMLPGIDGLEVCRRLRANPTTRDLPILMLTAKDDVHDKILGLETG